MEKKKRSRQIDEKLSKLAHRVDKTIIQCQRFEKMAPLVDTWAARWPTTALERRLHIDDTDLAERERALVALALKASAEAGVAIANYEPQEDAADHNLFYQVVRIEFEQRYRQQRPCSNPSQGTTAGH